MENLNEFDEFIELNRERLQELHAQDYMGTDDDMPDYFDSWLCTLNGEDYIKYGQSYGERTYIKGKFDLTESIVNK